MADTTVKVGSIHLHATFKVDRPVHKQLTKTEPVDLDQLADILLGMDDLLFLTQEALNEPKGMGPYGVDNHVVRLSYNSPLEMILAISAAAGAASVGAYKVSSTIFGMYERLLDLRRERSILETQQLAMLVLREALEETRTVPVFDAKRPVTPYRILKGRNAKPIPEDERLRRAAQTLDALESLRITKE